VPVVWKEQLVGALAALGSGRVFAPDELSSLTRVAELLGLELAEANALWRAQRQQQEAETKLKATRDLQAIIRRERDPDQLLERVDDRAAARGRPHARCRQREAPLTAGAVRAGARRFAGASCVRYRRGLAHGGGVPARRRGSAAGARALRALALRDVGHRPAI